MGHRRLMRKGILKRIDSGLKKIDSQIKIKLSSWLFYIVNLVLYHSIFNYGGMGMQLLTLQRGLQFYKSVYFLGHLTILLILIVPVRSIVDSEKALKKSD